MKPASFSYLRPASLVEALAAIEADQDGKLLAGGQSLLPLMNLRLARPSQLVDIGHLSELDHIAVDGAVVTIGALVRHARLERDPLIARHLPLLPAAAVYIGHRAIRNQGTLGGSLAHADPAAELPAAMVALGAIIEVESLLGGRREIPAENFFIAHYTTDLRPDEILTRVRVSALAPGDGWGFCELSPRRGDFALSGAACVIRRESGGASLDIRAAMVAMGAVPVLFVATVPAAPHPGLAGELAEDWIPRVTRDAIAIALAGDGDGDGDGDVLHRVALRRSIQAALAALTAGSGTEQAGTEQGGWA